MEIKGNRKCALFLYNTEVKEYNIINIFGKES